MEQLIFPVTKKEAEKNGKTYSSEANKKALFPSQLRDLRKKKGISQETLAHDLGVSKSTIGLYETGDTLPDAKTLRDLAVYFGVSADWLLGLSDYKDSKVNGITASDLCISENAAKIQSELWGRIKKDFNSFRNGEIQNGGIWQFYIPIWNDFLSSKFFLSLIHI